MDESGSPPLSIPLTPQAHRWVRELASSTASQALAEIDGATLLGERAAMTALRIPGPASAGGGCRFFDTRDEPIALGLSRPSDRELVPAWLETDAGDFADEVSLRAMIARRGSIELVERGRMLGLAIASSKPLAASHADAWTLLEQGSVSPAPHRAPRVVDLSSLWAGPLSSHLLGLAGAEVIKVESRTRPDAMRDGTPDFYALINHGKASVVVDLSDRGDVERLIGLLAGADIVIEAARPRALAQLGIDAAKITRTTPGLVWITITAHGATGEAANWIGFGDDCGVAAGLSAALLRETTRLGFVGDAIADPLTGIYAARIAWDRWSSGHGGRIGIAMSHVVARCMREAQTDNPGEFSRSLRRWDAHRGQAFPYVRRRSVGKAATWGEHSAAILKGLARC